ncbi:Uncharacterized membrane protein YcaP, DUF421 family [Georgenia satyanarayanai]|uniref:Uncharacterized membrane protein YcaP, DUF421 family n=1 Tax=Georgenia satyanarayanai TaxID=860221 RepID=A0A2Y9AL90_9MICO|nr:YetF domain-containing protein [Georgenia satyanarayanai]PYF98309.1 uncharacterized membrane protein YcaP (DUF421 family) [Georgenia satyanarayanai]SSA45194.1 Uncharacterized membrane protein YcaP, DUF421 family [Georgenia satyanarayanai]
MDVQELVGNLGISAGAAVSVVVSTTVLYLSFIVLTRSLGQRVLAGFSGFDIVVVIVLGAVLGRAILGHSPTLAAGLIAVVTLLALEGALGWMSSRPRWERLANNAPVLLMAGSEVLWRELRRTHVTESQLRSRLRQAGIRSDAEVAAVVLEPTGTLSVLRRGEPIAPAMLGGVRGAERMPPGLLGT